MLVSQSASYNYGFIKKERLMIMRKFNPRLWLSCQGSIAFEYVLVSLVGVGMSLFVMGYAKKMITQKLESFGGELDRVWEESSSLDQRGSFDEF